MGVKTKVSGLLGPATLLVNGCGASLSDRTERVPCCNARGFICCLRDSAFIVPVFFSFTEGAGVGCLLVIWLNALLVNILTIGNPPF